MTGVVLAGVAATAGTAVAATHGLTTARIHLFGGHLLAVTAVVIGLAVIGEAHRVVFVRGEQSEDLTLSDAAVVGSALLLPMALVPVAAAAGMLIGSVIVRRPAQKTVFNLGWMLAGASALVLVEAAVAGQATPLSARSVAGLLLGIVAFLLVNLVAIALVLNAADGIPMKHVVVEGWQLTAFMGAGNGGIAMVGVALAQRHPVLLPFTGLPVLALHVAYRNAAERADASRRTEAFLQTTSALLGAGSGAGALQAALPPLARALEARELQVVAPGLGVTVAADPHTARVLAGPPGAGRVETGASGAGRVLSLGREGELSLSGRGLDRPVIRQLLPSVTGLLTAAIRAHTTVAALTEETSKLNAVIDHASDGVIVWESDGRIAVWSPAAAALTGRSRIDIDALDGGQIQQVLRTLDAREGGARLDVQRIRDALRGGSGAILDVSIRRPDGERREIRLALAAAAAGEGAARVVGICHDVTAAHRLDRMKDDFVATVSHELRTPITPIKGYAKLLAARIDDMPRERRNHALALIEERADYLARLVDDLLLVSRVASSDKRLDVRMAEHDAAALVHRAVAAFPSLADRIDLRLPAWPVPVLADETRAVQCLSNLLSNSEKYSAAGTRITVRLEQAGGAVRLSVTDRGQGIPEGELGLVFDRFHRVDDSLTQAVGGSGLGLYIARQLARAMDGDLTCSSRLGVGSTFTLQLAAAGVLAEAV